MMNRYLLQLSSVLWLAVILVTGCSKSSTVTSDSAKNGGPSTLGLPHAAPLARLHWLGKKRLSQESNATNFVDIWSLPESTKLEAQTLDKLSTAPWRLLKTSTSLSNAPVSLLRPLLDDLVQEESYLEAQGATNRLGELVLAIRLDANRASLWQSNLPVLLKSLVVDATIPEVRDADVSLLSPNFYAILSRVGDWTLLSLADRGPQTSNSTLFSEFKSRIKLTGIPFSPRTTNYWVEALMDARGLCEAFDLRLKSVQTLPTVTFTVLGETNQVRTFGLLDFPVPVSAELEPWNIPTNLVYDPLTGFMAARGIRPLLHSLIGWDDSRLGAAPNQIYFWSQDGMPAFRFFAFPSPQPTNQLRLISEFLLRDVNPLMATFPNTTNVPLGSFEPIAGTDRVHWRGIPYVLPSFDITDSTSNAFIIGGLFPNRTTNQAAPQSLLSQLRGDSNLVLYDWEATKSTSFSLIQVSQAARFVFGRRRLSLTNNPALPWLVAISPKLGETASSVRLISPSRASFSRISTLGLTGAEIHLLTEWLESPSFPKGFFMLESPAITNASGSTPQQP